MKLPENFFHHDAQGFFLPDSHSGIDVDNIGHKQNTLIEGIRGTGKTHILKMIQRSRLENFSVNRVLPVYLSVAKISEHARKDPDIFRLYLYGNLVKDAVSAANINRDNFQPNKTLLEKSMRAIKGMFGIEDKEPIDRILDKINTLSESLFEEFEFGKLGKYISKEKEKNVTASKGGKTDANMSLLGNSISAGLTENTTQLNGERDQESIAYLGKQLSHNDAVDFLVTFLKQLQVLLDLDYTLLLIDECSEAPKEAQIEIFRLLKAVRGADSLLPESGSSCAYFVATVYPKSHTYYPTIKNDGFNFEPGHDFTTTFLQWDITDKRGYEKFFEDMIVNRAKTLLGYKKNSENFIKELFDNKDTFLLAMYAAHGIPRRFWEILKRAYYSGNGKIEIDNLSNTILGIAQEQIMDHSLLSDKDQDFLQFQAHRLGGVNGRTRENNKKQKRRVPQTIFLEISRKDFKEIQNIIMVGALHDMKRVKATKNKGFARPLYSLDISLAFSLKVIPAGEFTSFLKNDLYRNMTTDFKKALLVNSKHFSGSFYDDIEKVEDIYNDNISNISSTSEEAMDGEDYYGTIQEMTEYTNIILPDDGEQIAIFQLDNIVEQYRDHVNIGDRVVFNSMWVHGTRLATNISKIDVVESEGVIVKTFKNIFGTIELLEDGTEAYFLLKDTNGKVEVGDIVEFLLEETKTDKRKAYNIRKKEDTSNITLSSEMKENIAKYIYDFVYEEGKAISLASVASRIINKFGDVVKQSQWFGYHKFINFIESLELDNICIDKDPAPGYVSICQGRQKETSIKKPIDNNESNFVSSEDKLILKLSQEVGIPKLHRDEYDKVFHLLEDIVNRNGYAFNQTAKTLRDESKKHGIPLNRLGSNFILRGIMYAGHWFGSPEDKKKLKKSFLRNLLKLIEEHNIDISNNDKLILQKIFS